MNNTYKSKVGSLFIWLYLCVTTVLIAITILCRHEMWVLIIDTALTLVCMLMLTDMYLHTDYTINGDILHIRCGVLFSMRLPIKQITEISHNPSYPSSPALSMKRIGLKYGRNRWVYVSPRNEADFISKLKSVNPGITTTDKTGRRK